MLQQSFRFAVFPKQLISFNQDKQRIEGVSAYRDSNMMNDCVVTVVNVKKAIVPYKIVIMKKYNQRRNSNNSPKDSEDDKMY